MIGVPLDSLRWPKGADVGGVGMDDGPEEVPVDGVPEVEVVILQAETRRLPSGEKVKWWTLEF